MAESCYGDLLRIVAGLKKIKKTQTTILSTPSKQQFYNNNFTGRAGKLVTGIKKLSFF